MAILTVDQLRDQIDALIPDNDTGQVTTPILRQILTNMVDSLADGTPTTPPQGGTFSPAFSTAFN